MHFFRALQRLDILEDAREVSLGRLADLWQKARVFRLPLDLWREQYHSSVARFWGLTRRSRSEIARHRDVDAVLQVGAWFSSPAVTELPCYSYHDGNAALWYRYYGRGLLSEQKVQRHLAWERQNYARMRGVFVMSRWLADSFIQDFGMPAERVHVVGAGMNFDRLPDSVQRDFSIPKFLLVGRDFDRKGGESLLKAFRIVRQSVPNAELTIVGPEPRSPEPGVRYAGFLRKSDPADLKELNQIFTSATALILPSIYEPFGISLLEGMANYLPCITVDRCALPEIVVNQDTGLVAQPEDHESLASLMKYLASNPDRAREMGQNGRARVEAHYTWDAVARKIHDILDSDSRIARTSSATSGAAPARRSGAGRATSLRG
jgi:glycosyltransferase involved in cell wall biosynthesis